MIIMHTDIPCWFWALLLHIHPFIYDLINVLSAAPSAAFSAALVISASIYTLSVVSASNASRFLWFRTLRSLLSGIFWTWVDKITTVTVILVAIVPWIAIGIILGRIYGALNNLYHYWIWAITSRFFYHSHTGRTTEQSFATELCTHTT